MNARLALLAAVACGVLAVAAVAVDLAYTLTVSVETQDENGRWRLVERVPADGGLGNEGPLRGFDCAGPELLVTIDNDRPIGATRDVYIAYHNASSGRTSVVVDQQVELDRMTRETFRFTVPSEAIPTDNESTDPRGFPGGPGSTYVDVRVDDLHLSPCVGRTAPAAGPQEEGAA